MKALIIEDEKMAQANLARLLRKGFPGIEVVAMIGSVREAVAFLSSGPALDVVFMDVELSDGECFEIFRSVKVNVPVIMTTAYDSYAVKAFEAGTMDYLLKPLDMAALERAVGRVRERKSPSEEIARLLAAFGQSPAAFGHSPRVYKEKSTVKIGDRLIPVVFSDIAFFYSEEKANYLMMLSGEKYMIESTLDTLEDELDPKKFFRISRSCIVAFSAIKSVGRNVAGRLVVHTSPDAPSELTVSRSRVDDFISWLE